MEKQVLQVLEFHKAFGLPNNDTPTLIENERSKLRHKLLSEEVKEISCAAKNDDLVEIADGVIDCMYVLIGTSIEYGFADRIEDLFDEVHRSNMSKLGPDGKPVLRKDGKVMKSKSYSPPSLSKILDRNYTLYKKNETLIELANIERQITENKIRAKILSKLGIFYRFLFYINEKIESILKNKIEVKFPIKANDPIIVVIGGVSYEIN